MSQEKAREILDLVVEAVYMKHVSGDSWRSTFKEQAEEKLQQAAALLAAATGLGRKGGK